MTFQLVYTEKFEKRAIRFLKQHPDVKQKYLKTLQLLELNPHHPSLRLHRLSGKLKTYHSASIDMFYRITLEFEIRDNMIILVDVGAHDDVY
jgi:mRNA-degrading endonuclease YafQ of YafQ-DinJ toxin-antitoxin module